MDIRKVKKLIAAQSGSFRATLGDTVFTERKAFAEELRRFESLYLRRSKKSFHEIGTYGDYPFSLEGTGIYIDEPRMRINVDGIHFEGNMLAGAEYHLRNFENRVVQTKRRVGDHEAAIVRLNEALNRPFPQADDLKNVIASVNAIESDMALNPEPAPAAVRIGLPVDAQVFVGGRAGVVVGHEQQAGDWFARVDFGNGTIESVAVALCCDADGSPLLTDRESSDDAAFTFGYVDGEILGILPAQPIVPDMADAAPESASEPEHVETEELVPASAEIIDFAAHCRKVMAVDIEDALLMAFA